jgi:hypothetical protein
MPSATDVHMRFDQRVGERSDVFTYTSPYVARRDFITESGKRTKALVRGDVVITLDIPQARFERP